MPWIEGIGDEVIITFSILIGIFIVLAAWSSTGIREIPFISVIIVQLTRRRVTNQNGSEEGPVSSPENSQNEESRNESEEFNAEPLDATEDHVGESRETTEQKCNINEDIPAPETDISTESSLETEGQNETENLTEFCLRQKRIEFLSRSAQNRHSEHTEENVQQVSSEPVEKKSTDSERVTNTKSLSQIASNILTEGITNTVGDLPGSSVDDGSNNSGSNTQPESGGRTDEPVPEPGHIRVRIKFLNDTQRLVTCLPTETIGNFRRIHFSTELSESKLVRFIFNGQDLRNDLSTLQSYNIIDNSVLHCLISQPRPDDQPHPGSALDDGFDIGLFMFPLFGLLLCIVWYMRFMYRQFFNVTSTLTLAGITFLYVAAFLSTLRGRQVNEHLE